jgi:hypothetical protein
MEAGCSPKIETRGALSGQSSIHGFSNHFPEPDTFAEEG